MPSDVDTVVAEMARAIDADLPRLTTELTGLFIEVIPEFRHDDTVRQLMVASTSSNLAGLVQTLIHSIASDRVTVPPAAAEYARRFAQHSLSLEALLQAYRLGEHEFVQWGIAAVGRAGGVPTADALAAVAEFARRTHSYINRVTAHLTEIYEAERRRWDSRADAGHATRIRLVLESENLSEAGAQQLLGVPLAGTHVAAVAWLEGDGQPAEAKLRAAARLLHSTNEWSPLTMLADDRTLWTWVPGALPRSGDLHALRQGVAAIGSGLRVALGAPGKGLAGFRGSLREAIRARAVAENAGVEGGDVVAFDDVAVAALLTSHSEDLKPWVDRVLGGLGEDGPVPRELRATLRVFLEEEGSFTRAAERLHVHKNTVHYRVRKAEGLRGRPVSEGRLNLEVALIAASLLRKRVSGPAAHSLGQ